MRRHSDVDHRRARLCSRLAILAVLVVSGTAAHALGRGKVDAHDHSSASKGGATLNPPTFSVGGVALGGAGAPVQVAFTSSTATGTGTTDMPWDDTIPQITEGDQILASTMTPRSASSRLIVRASAWVAEDSNVSAVGFTCCLFRDAAANSIGGCKAFASATNAEIALEHFNVNLETIVAANAASPTVFSLRCGLFGTGAGGTLSWNRVNGIRALGGAMVTTIVVTEVR